MKQNLARTSLYVTIILFIGYIISFSRESIIAYLFGVSADVDAYTVAITIPINLFSIITISIQSIIIPIYSKLIYSDSTESTEHYVNSLLSILALLTIGLILLFELISSPIAYLFAPGLSPETHDLVVSLLRLVLPTIFFSLISNVFIGILNVHKSFLFPAFSVWFLNIGIIITILVLNHKFGILSACVGQILGSLIQFIFLYLLSRKYIRYKISLDLKNPAIIETGRKILPVMWSTCIAELNAIINRAVASFLFVGAISALNYASKMNTVLMTFFTSAIATVIYPLYAESTANKNIVQLNDRINLTLSAYTYLLLPLMFGVLCYKSELIEVAFGRGAFDTSAIDLTQQLLGCYAFGMLFFAFRETVTKVYYSLNDTITPAKNASIGIAINIILSLILPYIIGIMGLALASTISAAYVSLVLIIKLLKIYPEIKLLYFFTNIKKQILPLLLMSICMLIFRYCFDWTSAMTLIIGGLTSIIIYFAVSYIISVPIFIRLIRMLVKK